MIKLAVIYNHDTVYIVHEDEVNLFKGFKVYDTTYDSSLADKLADECCCI